MPEWIANGSSFACCIFDENHGSAYYKALAWFEKPLLKEILIQCHGNQTKAAEIVGLNRGNFRETIIQHKLHKEVN